MSRFSSLLRLSLRITLFSLLGGLLPPIDPSPPYVAAAPNSILVQQSGTPAVARINSGATSAATFSGTTWSADQGFTGGRTTNSTLADIANTTDDALYRDVRTGNTDAEVFTYTVSVPANATYTVRLHFAETYWGVAGGFTSSSCTASACAGRRVFDVNLEGGPIDLANYDVNADVGPAAAVVKSFTLPITDGALTVVFAASVNRPLIAAIEVLPTTPLTPTPTPPSATNTPLPASPTPTAPPSATNTPLPASATPTTPPTATAPASATPTSGTAAPTTTLTFAPVADTFVDQNTPTTAYGTFSFLGVVGETGKEKQAFLRFNISGVPAGATVQAATLRLFVTNDSSSGGSVAKMSDTKLGRNRHLGHEAGHLRPRARHDRHGRVEPSGHGRLDRSGQRQWHR